jgi:uncharacterized FAD-dependent dehydrogenase
MKAECYDVVIVGAGPAGIFAAIELTRRGAGPVLVLEKGRDIERRSCPAREIACVGCPQCHIMTGWGGAGAFSDGKLTLTTQVGGWLCDFMPEDELEPLIDYADHVWLDFGADDVVYEPQPATAAALVARAESAGMRLVPMRVRHIGTDRSPRILQAMREYLEDAGVDIRTDCGADRVVVEGDRVVGVELSTGGVVRCGVAILAPGREGADWLAGQAQALGIEMTSNPVDIGVRVECAAEVMEHLTVPLYEAKLLYSTPTFGDSVRTFCMNPHGEVTTESYGDVVTVNGHSYAGHNTRYTNFAILVSQRFTYPFRDPIEYGRSVARLANLLGDGILVQRFIDLVAGRRSTPARIAESDISPTLSQATPGDLSCVLPYRHMTDVMEFMTALDLLAPGITGRETLLYGVEVKFYSSRVEVDSDMRTRIEGLYAVGDGAGITRGLAQSGASGIIAARAAAAGA